jgi:predicted RecA/RadA family phage recombinase
MAQAIYVQDGESVDYTPTTDTPAGTVVVQSQLVGVTSLDIAANALGALRVFGVFDFAKVAAVAFNYGDLAYWDNTAKVATNVTVGNTLIGKVVRAAAAADPTLRVRLSQ